jgi:hypothetical protein
VVKYVPHPEDILTFVLDRGVNFTLLSPYLRGKSPGYPLDRRLGGIHSQSGCCGEEKNALPLPHIEPIFLGCPSFNFTH